MEYKTAKRMECLPFSGIRAVMEKATKMQQAARVSDDTAFFLVGEVVEKNATSEIFARPRDKRTEDYITGRFG